MTALESFNFIQFKAIMGISDIDEPTYALILRAVFDNLETEHEILVDDLESITSDLVFAVYRHAKFIFEVHKSNLDTIKSTSDSSGNRTTFEVKTPADVIATYKMYSARPPAYL